MKNRLKFIALGFFSERTARKATGYGYGIMFLSFAAAAVFLVLGFIGALLIPFRTLYRNSADFKTAVEEVFCAVGSPVLTVSDGRLSATFADPDKKAFDTIADEEDGRLVTRACDVIIDTRPSGLYDDFTAYCVSEDGDRITYEEYLELSEASKKSYKFGIEYSGKERVIDDEDVDAFENYLAGTDNAEVAEEYKKLPSKTDEKYMGALYELYVKTYYPDLSAYEIDGAAPKLRNFYFHNYATRANILFVFDDALVGRFESSSGAQTTFYGFYGGLSDGTVAATSRGMEDFLVECFSASKQLVLFSNFTGIFTLVSYMVIIVILLSAILFCTRKLAKTDEVTFGGAVKTVGAYSLFGGLLSGLIGFAFGFVVSARYFTTVLCMAYFGVVLLRIAAGAIADCALKAKENKRKAVSEIDGGDTNAAENAAEETVQGGVQ